ncbi:hypothetical protein HY642_00490 [Candidatus Woesearchaeota archaeon]|nr:hypothetical protein [Candidatus Woesearchaeota archaeon]
MPELERTVIKEAKGKLLKIAVPHQHMCQGKYELSRPWMLEDLAKGFDTSATYTFLRTVANPDAVEALTKAGIDRRYSAKLHDLYLEALHATVPSFCSHVYYPLIQNVNVRHLDRHADYPVWPVIHVVQGHPMGVTAVFCSLEKPVQSSDISVGPFEFSVINLNGKEAYEFIKKRDAPQNYCMPAVDFLRKKKIPPLELQSRRWTVKGSELRNAIDFLCQWQYTANSTAPVSDAD